MVSAIYQYSSGRGRCVLRDGEAVPGVGGAGHEEHVGGVDLETWRVERVEPSPWSDVYPALSLVELLQYCALIGPELHALKGPIIGALSDATPALLCHKEPARASKAPY